MDLNKAYNNWFGSLSKKNKGTWSAPTYKNVKRHNGSYRNGMCKKDPTKLIVGDKIFIPCCKEVKFKGTVDVDKIVKIYNITVKRTNTNKYFCSICCDIQVDEYEHTGEAIGLDLGIKDQIICSNGEKFENKRFLAKTENKIKKLQKQFSKKKKGSKNQEKYRLKLAIAHEKLSNQRNNHLHQITSKIVKNHDVICIENLNVKGMMKNHHLAKALTDVSLGALVNMLQYKCTWYNRQLVKIDRWFPSSKICNCCGYKMKDMNLSIREWTCPNCNTQHDRDINAAKNILNEGLRILDIGSERPDFKPAENPTMDERSVKNLKSSGSMKQENQLSLAID